METLQGKRIAFTGTLAHFTRQGVFAVVGSLNGYPQTAVDFGTDVLVVGKPPPKTVVGPTGKSRKVQAAEENGVTVMTEAEFLGYVPFELWDKHRKAASRSVA